MRSAGLRLWVKGVWCSCQTAFAVERDILANVAPPRSSSMGPTSSIPSAAACSVKVFRFGWNFLLQGSTARLGILQKVCHPVH